MSSTTPELSTHDTHSEPKSKPKRKKTARACQHCHKTHMTCDAGRPCKRCVSKGLQDSCFDAPRKKKKYLMDVPESLESLTNNSVTSTPLLSQSNTDANSINNGYQNENYNNNSVYQPLTNDLSSFQLPSTNSTYYNQNNIIPVNPQRSSSKFMSNAINNEYSILSDIIKRDNQFYNSNISESTLSPPHNNSHEGINNTVNKLRHSSVQSHNSRNSTPTPNSSSSFSHHDIYNVHKQTDRTINQYKLGTIQDQTITYPEVMKIIDGELSFTADNELTTKKDPNRPALSFSIAINENSEINGTPNTTENPNGLRFKEAEDIYAKIDAPFSYTPGFHSLIQYLRQRFNATDLIKMAKSMASYRPSFIACTNTLKEEDLIFMEQCFQRTLLEYDKFISISGTPTIVWRRTGQISYVSEEFSILTGWARDNLLNKVTFIVELMDDSSVIEYFDLFSTIAYGDFKAATMGSCTLLTPDNSRIKTTCIWTLKRDVFGIPMMIIGNFLPIL